MMIRIGITGGKRRRVRKRAPKNLVSEAESSLACGPFLGARLRLEWSATAGQRYWQDRSLQPAVADPTTPEMFGEF